jgi:predicted Rossmann fold nucleotide-binding protein DprA/Smf involved in DNA uptake
MLRLLGDDPTHINDLGHASGLPMNQVGSLLLLMELKGLVRQTGAGQYVRA